LFNTLFSKFQRHITVLCITLLALGNYAQPALSNPSDSTAAKRTVQASPASNIPIVSEQRLGSKTFAVGSVLVNARAEKIWEILTDYNNAPDIFSSLQKCEVVQDNGPKKLVRQLIHPKGTFLKLDYIVEIKETAPTLMEWHRTSGAFKEVAGSWRLEQHNNNGPTKITYSIYLDGGVLLPPWLLRGQSKIYLPELLTTVKRISEQRQASAQNNSESGRS
jgi:ribosome-associated toxin RatA of RatAB toxin-antitoxin module